MRRFVVLGAGVLLFVIIGTVFLGCGGGAAVSGIVSITLSPSNLSLNRGATAQIAAQALDANNNLVSTPTLAFHSSNPAITVSSNGLICAGQWDATFINCRITDNNNNVLPLATLVAPASITATATVNDRTITSSAVVVTDHERIDSLQVCLVDGGGTHCPAPATGCVSQNGTAQYAAQAFSNDPQACQRINGSTATPCQVPNDTIGSINWQVSPAQVATADATTHTATDPVKLTAAAPGQGVVVGLVGPSGSTVSGSAPFTTCAVANIHVHQQGDTDTSFTAPVGGTVPLVADVRDSLGAMLTSTLTLTWLTSQPALARVSAGTAQGASVQALAPGTASITAACLPPSCNVNFVPPQAVYSDNVVTANITGTAASTVLATTSTAPASSSSSNAIVPINTSTNQTSTAFTLPANLTVNSMVMTPLGNPAFLGTVCASGTTGPNGAACSGLLAFDPTVTAVAAPLPSLTGKVLATDGTYVVLSDPPTNPTQVLIALPAAAVATTLSIANATAAAITEDGTKIYIVAGSKLFIYNPGLPLQSIDLSPDTASTSSQGIAFFATGAMAYVADLTGNDAVIATCKNATDAILDPVPVSGSPTHIAAVPNATAMVDANSPNIDEIDASSNGACPPVITPTPPMPTSHGFPNVSDFAAKQLIVTPDSKLAIILGDTCTTGTVAACSDSSHQGVLVYNLDSKQTSLIPLAGGARAISGAVTPDSATLYLGASDGNVHRVDLNSGTDAQSITVALCPSVSGGCNPDFVVVRPVATVATLSSIAVTPANPSISVGATQQFTATGTFSDRTTRDLTNFATWTSSNTVVAIIGPNTNVTPPLAPGEASALATGTTTISAASGGVSGSTTLTVR